MSSALSKLFSRLDEMSEAGGVRELQAILEECPLTRADLEEYCIFREEKYQRNIVKTGKWYELLVLCWKSGQASLIHDHKGSNCAFRIIQGTATEVVCETTGALREEKGVVRAVSTRSFVQGQVCASTSEDIHEVSNTQPVGQDLITLHLYSPELHMQTYMLETGNGWFPHVLGNVPSLPGPVPV